MKKSRRIVTIAVFLLSCLLSFAQDSSYDVFAPIGKYLSKGNSEALSAWFADNLQISVISQESTASKSQARQIVKAFFETYTPRDFNITHTAGRANMKYALGVLNAGGELFSVTIFVTRKSGTYKIQMLNIARI